MTADRIKICFSIFILVGFILLGAVACKSGGLKPLVPPNADSSDHDQPVELGYTVDSATYTYKTTGAEALKLDIFSPEIKDGAGKSLPVIILFHGGGWRSGGRGSFRWQCRYLAQHGIVGVTADYRFIDKNAQGVGSTKEICIWDAKSAVRWVRSHAGELHINPDKVILGGGSAGGHLATMVALDTTMNDPTDDVTISTKALALVLFNPAYRIHEKAMSEPYNRVSSATPPTIMFFGRDDATWKPGGDSLYALLKQKGIKSEMWIADGQAHAFFNKEPWRSATCIKAHAFLVECGLMQGLVLEMPSGGTLVPEINKNH
jgi:acetyl esterase/lipase